ncbi:MAG: hypothetical protein JWN98_489 [Abditibacteriota bacterium]|nr:hypothetical protein [Abditibacteriota bacterium]
MFWPGLILCVVLAASWRGLMWRANDRAHWTTVASGVEMRRFDASEHGLRVPIVAFRVAPERLHIAVGNSLSATSWRRKEKAIAAMNGGYFDVTDRSLGLRVSDGRQVASLHGKRWSVFRIKNGAAAILPASDVAAALKRGVRYQQAVQCGPMLVRDGKVGTFKAQWARRTGLGVTRDNRVILAVADGQLSLLAWAQLWAARDGLNCPNALNLDGGSSTQLSLRTSKSTLEIASGRPVPDALVIK